MNEKPSVAVVVGGANCVYEEYAAAKAMCDSAGIAYQTIVVNDMIPAFNDHLDHAVTLHPQKLKRDEPKWLVARAQRGLNHPGEVWSHRNDNVADAVTRICKDHWLGSSGLFATKIAIFELRCDRVLLCGIPMTVQASHFLRGKLWRACPMFTKYWEQHHVELVPYVRSFSGYTRDLLGPVTLDFVLGNRNGSALAVAAHVGSGAAATL